MQIELTIKVGVDKDTITISPETLRYIIDAANIGIEEAEGNLSHIDDATDTIDALDKILKAWEEPEEPR